MQLFFCVFQEHNHRYKNSYIYEKHVGTYASTQHTQHSHTPTHTNNTRVREYPHLHSRTHILRPTYARTYT